MKSNGIALYKLQKFEPSATCPKKITVSSYKGTTYFVNGTIPGIGQYLITALMDQKFQLHMIP
jgi:hypothetical protein